MYIPKLRTMSEVVEYFKSYDNDTAVTCTLLQSLAKQNIITAVRVGTKLLVNLDECLSIFMRGTAQPANITTHLHCTKRIMRSTGEICRLFNSVDKDTRVRKSLIKSAIVTHDIFAVWLPQGFWRVNLTEFANLFTNGKTFEPCTQVPRIRHYEDSYHIIKREHSHLKFTWNKLHDLVHGKTVTAFYHGNRWLVNLDEIDILL